MPGAVKKISCCYCDAATLVNLTKVGRGVLTCDACGARLSSARMESVINKPVPVAKPAPKRACGGGPGALDPRWHGTAGGLAGFGAGTGMARPKKKKKPKPKKRRSFLDRLEDLWDEIEDIID